MGKYISFGKYNKLYKYIWIFIIIKIIIDYFFSDTFPKQIQIDFFRTQYIPPNIIVDRLFYYLGSFIFTIFFTFYERKALNKKKSKEKEEQKEEEDDDINSINNNNNVNSNNIKVNKTIKNLALIYYKVKLEDFELELKPIIITSLISLFSFEIILIFMALNWDGLIYWVFDLFFIAYTNLLLFNIDIYEHKKCAIAFRLIVSTTFQILASLEYIYNDKYNLFYKNHIFLIPIIIIVYLFLSLSRCYSLSRIKWLLDYKYIPISLFLRIYNFLGLCIMLSACLIANFVKCVNKDALHDIDLICLIKIDNGNNTEYYFDNFLNYFQKIWHDDKTTGINIIYVILFIIKLFLNALSLLYSLIIIKFLSPEYFLIAYDIYFFVFHVLSLINAIICDENIRLKLFQLISEAGGLIGIMIYLELIGFKFCSLNRYLKKILKLEDLLNII